MNPQVASVNYQRPYSLILTFNNNEVKQFDLERYLNYPVYKPLKDEAFYQKAEMFNGTVKWDDFTDFDPDLLYLESKPIH